ncbi:MAG: hypothetical protein EBU12_10150, partial [Microbacteriaceae bacterium]|nr:hypothetical protein [Microbacteriaceae bacterium]
NDVGTATNYNWGADNNKYINGSSQGASGYTVYGSGDVVGLALNVDANTLQFYRNGSATFSFSSLPAKTWFPWLHINGFSFTCNFGQRQFAYTAPSGFKALCTTNLPAPLVTKPNTVMDVKLYTGNGSTQTISGLSFSPDFVWLKCRSSTPYHRLYDQIRGVTKALYSNSTDAEGAYQTTYENFTSFNSDGFSLGTTTIDNGINGNGQTFAAWCWDAGTSTVTNTQGSITSTVRANATAGFSVVTYTGTGSAATVGHGLGAAPGMILIKGRTSTSDWPVFHSGLGSQTNDVIVLNSTGAKQTITNYWNGGVSSTVFGVLNGTWAHNTNGVNYVAYCFAPVVGYSSMGSYVGNGSSDGPFVYTGFRPRWVLLKLSSSSGGDWALYDTARGPYNLNTPKISPDSSAIEDDTTLWGGSPSSYGLDFLSNGFKLRNTAGGSHNGSGFTYIYAAFAESPFNYARAR